MKSITIEKAKILDIRLTQQITDNSYDFFNQHNPDKYLELINSHSKTTQYNHISMEVQQFYNHIEKNVNSNTTELFHKLILIKLIINNFERVNTDFPKCITRLFLKNFDRILKNIESNAFASGFYLYPKEKFLKDLGVCSLQLIPAGSQKLEITGFSRKFIFKKDINQFFNFVMFNIFKTKGNSPFYQMHTDIHDRDSLTELNPKGAVFLFLRVAELLKRNPKIKGIFGSSWMNDPQLAKISPAVFSGAKITIENGGRLYYNGSNSQIISGAIFASPNRTRLYKEGHYEPASYIQIWSRHELLRWASKQDKQDL